MGQGQAEQFNRPPQQQWQPQSSLSKRMTKLEDTLQQFMQVFVYTQKSTKSAIRNLEIQVGQLAKKLEDMFDRSFGANIAVNPKEECNVIMTRSGKMLDERKVERKERNEKEKQYGRFMEIFKQLEITMPLTEALQQIPAYAKHMKQFLKEKKYIDKEKIEVQGNCSAILQKTLPPKFKDPGSFIIPCTIGNHDIGKALVDLGASINLMSLFILKKIGGLEVKPTKAILQMVDRSIKHPYGVVEDVVVKIDKVKFLVDFVVMEMEENVEIPLILGRPFMKKAKVVIHVDDGVITLKEQDEEVTLNVFEAGQPIQVTRTSPKAKDDVLSVTSLPDKVVKTVKRNHSCCFPRLKEDDRDKEEKLVHHYSMMENNELYLGKPVKFKN
ncbi:uncharacterized protein LOC124846130, partial [Vigna umbellata]|uniref:uncharacterized protein LOC124846130 n=1 Tax=Vigna umbellata TaxID=87088 RepID=UPI001F5E7351